MNDQYEPEISGHSCIDIIPGWNKELESAFSFYKGPYLAGRVVTRQKKSCDVLVSDDIIKAEVADELLGVDKQPVVGDFVVLLEKPGSNEYVVVDILPRRTCLSRGASGDCREEQVIAANIDTVFIVMAIGNDLNLQRLDLYLNIVSSSGAKPVILLNKIDLVEDPSQLIQNI